MKKAVFASGLSIAALVTLSCDLILNQGGTGTVGGGDRIDFSKLKVGQESRYVYFTGDDYRSSENNDFQYHADTLVVHVVDSTPHGFRFREFLTAGSASRTDSAFVWQPDSIFSYFVQVSGDSLFVFGENDIYHDSRLFFNYTEHLGLNDISAPELDIRGWKTSLSYCECYRDGFVKNYQQLGGEYDRLNIVIDNRHMMVDGPGKTFIYSEKHGIVRSTQVNWWTNTGVGWDLL